MQEIDQVMHAAAKWSQRTVLATIVRTEGSSYRKPGAVMLVGEDGTTVGAVSGGCIEKEIVRRSQAVFASGQPELVEYDGRYTLGCNGTLFILIEPFAPKQATDFFQNYHRVFAQRQSWSWVSQCDECYQGSCVIFPGDDVYALRDDDSSRELEERAISLVANDEGEYAGKRHILVQQIPPSLQLIVIGSEIDALKLATIADEVGYVVTLVLHPLNNEVSVSAPNISVITASPEQLGDTIRVDLHTALVLTTHSYARDLGYLRSACNLSPVFYLGIVGPRQRADDLLSELLERGCELPNWFDRAFRAPVGLDLGGQFPAEIAISILSELQQVQSGHTGGILSEKNAGIHTIVGN